MYVLFLCLGALTDAPATPPFILRHDWPATGKPALYLPHLKNYSLTAAPDGDHQGPELFQTTELTWVSAIPKQYPPRTVRLIT